ncbi:flagellar hook-length control protein FliK [Halomonas sp. McH1-25]|uniref:flagellar hook-length control protein FliK n=1 Tax=unclassified Halomonas TaxID=2609666 RepID=UPI001EF6FC45|nr:flagellar hook-length control protein FliK [Halomonas sp. McH1-25]MCP1342314.1 flagellar hook-length control protein FliK [Halomonas sp. FL8]MCP1360649.1 flagellar hook-length control protein FliK [Halomonas sp. BBD45]MCP1364780.1 flagellar hook-length control protein FliK [Halomonas sp. BBD48]
MSGIITPILDTLLHEVLGKRVESQTHRELTEPVRPLSPGHAPRALHSDSRLNAEQAAAQRQTGIGGSASSSPTLESASLAPASTRTHFSVAARNIADVLAKFPAPPAVVKSPAPLVAAGETVDASQLASRLRQSIETSGLFYESHLARWHRGDLSRSLLAREPQMQFFIQRTQAGVSAVPEGQERILIIGERVADVPGRQSGRAMPQLSAPLVYTPPSSAASMQSPLLPGQPGETQLTQGQAVYQTEDAALETLPRGTSSVDGRAEDALHGIVRHQLELMVTPTLRWEGDLWSGVFMALAIHVPEALERHGEGGKEKGEQGEESDEAAWHSELTLQLPRLGALGVNFYLRENSLNMTLECDNESIVSTLRAESHELEARFRRCGLADVKVGILSKRDTSEIED